MKTNRRTRAAKDSRNVFVVHGRNELARKALFSFLRSIGLQPFEWSKLVSATNKPAPSIGEILDVAFSKAQAVIVLLTPDDEARLREKFRSFADPPYESVPMPQARPNVLFEAGMAMGRYPDRTIIVELGVLLRPFSDIAGRHVVKLTDSTMSRQELAQRLITAGCSVDLTGTDWHQEGDFNYQTLNVVGSSLEASFDAPPAPSKVEKFEGEEKVEDDETANAVRAVVRISILRIFIETKMAAGNTFILKFADLDKEMAFESGTTKRIIEDVARSSGYTVELINDDRVRLTK